MRARNVILSLCTVLVLAGWSLAVENKGAEHLQLPGGKRGLVPFPHHQHQDVLVDCKVCHEYFPQEKGVIEKMKAQGQLKSKLVMNKLCTKCHKTKKKAGENSGPTSCKKCHLKNE